MPPTPRRPRASPCREHLSTALPLAFAAPSPLSLPWLRPNAPVCRPPKQALPASPRMALSPRLPPSPREEEGAPPKRRGKRNTATRIATGAAVVVGASIVCAGVVGFAKPAEAIRLAPAPINAYARKRQERAYQMYMTQLERRFEAVSAADFRKVVEAGGGGLGVSYRVAGVAAFVASAFSTAIVHPLDTLKTRSQARSTEMGRRKADLDARRRKLVLADAAASAAVGAAFSDGVAPETLLAGQQGTAAGGSGEAEKKELVVVEETDCLAVEPLDTSGLYRGMVSNIMKEAPNAAIYLGVYELLKNFLLSTSVFQNLPLLVFVIAGALGDAIGSLVRCPAEIVNKRLQLGVNDNAWSALRDAFFSAQGRQSSLVAWGAVLWRDVPYGGIQIALYEFGKQYIIVHSAALPLQPGIFADVITGAVAGMIAAMMTTPADVLVTRLSVQNPQSYLETRKFMGVTSTLRRIVREEGVVALFSGCLQRGVYYAPLIGLFFALYEGTRHVVADPQVVVASISSLQERLTSLGQFLQESVFAATPRTMGDVGRTVFMVSSAPP